MWYIYSFKLAYAQDNSFELRVNTDWTCSEFVEKVTSIARLTFPSISVTDVMHVTESWNYTQDPNYRHNPSEENTPIPLSYQTIGSRYNSRYFEYLHFYIYFRDECQAIQLRHSRNESRTLEQHHNAYCEYYYDLWFAEQDNRMNDSYLRVGDEPSYILPTGSYNRDTDIVPQPTWGFQWGWTGMNSQYAGGVSATSQAVSLDVMMNETNNSPLLPRNLLDDNENEYYFEQQQTSYDNIYNITNYDIFTPQRLTNDLIQNNSSTLWNIPELPINTMIANNIENYIEPEPYIPRPLVTSDCCICFTEETQCFVLEYCNHTVCGSCYTGVFTRLNGSLDLRCPMCRIPNSFTGDIYHQITGTHI